MKLIYFITVIPVFIAFHNSDSGLFCRRHKVAEIDMSAYWQSSQEPSSLGFENIVYNVEHQPLHHGISINRELTEETSELTMQETSNGGPMNSFRNERLDS